MMKEGTRFNVKGRRFATLMRMDMRLLRMERSAG